MVESSRIYGKADSDMSDSKDKVIAIATVTAFKFHCNLCGKGGHKQRTVPSVTRSNADTAVDRDTRKKHAGT